MSKGARNNKLDKTKKNLQTLNMVKARNRHLHVENDYTYTKPTCS